jgi:hypothetical protein
MVGGSMVVVVPRRRLYRQKRFRLRRRPIEEDAQESRKEKVGNDSSKLVRVAVARDTRETLQLVAGGHQVNGSCLETA